MSVDVRVEDHVDCSLELVQLERFLEGALDTLGRAGCDMSVLLCDDATIRPLNREWRGRDRPTDVLSFPQNEFQIPNVLDGEATPGGPPLHLGDVVLSLETAQRQAGELCHDLRSEVHVLLIHGLCHLLGWDHEEALDAIAMGEAETRVLSALEGSMASLVSRAHGHQSG